MRTNIDISTALHGDHGTIDLEDNVVNLLAVALN